MLMVLGFCQQTMQKISKAAEELWDNALIAGILNRCLHTNLHKLLLGKFCIDISVRITKMTFHKVLPFWQLRQY